MGLLLALLPLPLVAQRPLNLDFEMSAVAYPDRPWGWSLGWSAFAAPDVVAFRLDSGTAVDGRRSLRATITDSSGVTEPVGLMLQLPAAFVRGKRLQLRAQARTDGPAAQALVTLEAWGDRRVPAADSLLVDRPTDGWPASRVLQIDVPDDPEIHSLVVQVAVSGRGTAWFDGLALSVDGEPLTALPTVAAPDAGGLRWLRTHATPLRTVDPAADGSSERDLAEVDRIIGQATVVGLGESTHGTREFFEAKARIIRHLVAHRGFRVFAVEANQVAVERVDRYVRGEDIPVREAMRAMFAVWNTEAMEGLLAWLRTWNATHPDDRVLVVGYDMQDHRLPIEALRVIAGRLDPAFTPRIEALSGEYNEQPSYATPNVPDSVRARWGAQADTLWQETRAHLEAWRGRGGPHDADRAMQAANLYRQAARFNVTLFSPDRDSLMAANLDWALATLAPGARAVVWAHDVHVAKGGDPDRSFNAGAEMGAYLRRSHGDDYRAFSFLTAQGSYTATRSFTDHRQFAAAAFPAPPGSLEDALHRLDRPLDAIGWIVDLRPARLEPAGRWLGDPRPIRSIGFAAYDYGFEMQGELAHEFDAVVFIDATTPSRRVP